MAGLLDGKVGLVTGASGGIGKEIARLIVAEGGKVVIVDVSSDAGNAAATEIGDGALFVEGDVTSAESMDSAVAAAVEKWGKLDVAFNNAGVDLLGPKLHETEPDQWNRIMDVNLTGVYNSMRSQLKQMLTQGNGSIVNIGSVSSYVGAQGLSAYVASKHGMVGLTKAAALDYATSGIRINAVAPGFVLTPMAEASMSPEMIEASSQQIPMQRMATPNEIAEAAVWIASDRASYALGTVLTVDGGFIAK